MLPSNPHPDAMTRADPASARTATASLTPGADIGQHLNGPLTPGQAVGGRYRVLALLGRGGMGAVYKAWDEQLGTVVALKAIALAPGTDAETAALLEQRFRREALLARQITHRHVVRVHDLIEVEGVKYLTMAFVEGETLSERMRRSGPMDPREVLPIVRQVAEGLAAAHDAGVVHRDLKPANVMIATSGEACIMDFGIARSSNTTVTQSGVVVGTLEYMAPEQLQGGTADGRTDVYALGLIAYDMLVGRRRLEGVDQPMLEAVRRTQHPLPPVVSRRPEVPAALAQVIDRAVLPHPDQRMPSAHALLDQLGMLAADGHVRQDLSQLDQAAPPDWWRRLRITGIGLVASALILFAGWQWRPWQSAVPAGPPTPTSVVVAEFENRTTEAVFDGLLDQAMAIGLEGASFINVYPRRDALRQAATLAALGLDLNTARLIGLREGIPFVVSGSIDGGATGYRLHVDVHGASPDGGPVFTASADGVARERVLEEAGRMAVQVRRALGDGTVNVEGASPTETFTASSLEAAAAYVQGQELLAAGNRQAAFEAYERAVTLDPNLGRAWSGMGTVAYNQRRLDDAERYLREALAHVDRMTEREQFRTRGTYYDVVGNPDQARDVLEALVARFPSDAAGLANLALAHFKAWHLSRALEVGRQAAALYPRNVLRQSNVALYALYASRFEDAAEQVALVRSLNADYPYAQLAAAMIDVTAGRWDEAIAGYERLATLAAPGPSLSIHGLVDLASHRGRLNEAAARLEAALTTADGAAVTRLVTALARIRVARGDASGAVAVLARLPDDTTDPAALLEAGEAYLVMGRRTDAARMADRITRRLGLQAETFAAVLRAAIAIADGRARDAHASLVETRQRADAWLVRYWLGRSFLALGAFAEADSEFDACLRRRGEALAVFLDDYPTYQRLAEVHYYQGIARAGLNSPGAADAFATFLAPKEGGDETTGLVADARQRLGALRTNR